MPCFVFDGVEEFFGTQLYSVVLLVLFLFKLGRTLGIAFLDLASVICVLSFLEHTSSFYILLSCILILYF